VLPGVLWPVEFVAAVFFSHPAESNIVVKVIATNVERNVVFTGLKRLTPTRYLDHHQKHA
jgi:hypothetical protein